MTRKNIKNDLNDTFSVVDLALPASTNVKDIVHQFRLYKLKSNGDRGMTVVFSTYQSIEVIAKAQLALRKEYPELDEFADVREETQKLKRVERAREKLPEEGICDECGNPNVLFKTD